MKNKRKIVLLTLLVSIVIFPNYYKLNQFGDVPQKIIVSGKIDNYDSSHVVSISVNRIGFNQEEILAKTDSSGNFIAIFESYIPVDAFVSYKTHFFVLLHPNDSLFVRFDGKFDNQIELLASTVFSGDAAKRNQFAAKFQQIYYSNEISDWNKNWEAIKKYNPDQYLQYLDTIQQKSENFYDQFVAEITPDEESKKWALLYLKNNYHQKLGWYAYYKHALMGWNDSLYIPKGYYDKLCDILPIDYSMFISAYAISDFSFIFGKYVADKMRDIETGGMWYVAPEGFIFPTTPTIQTEIIDSITISGIIEFVHDPILRQIMLTSFFDKHFEEHDIVTYERLQNVVNPYIKETFLKEPFFRKYVQTKQRIDNAMAINQEIILKESSNLSVNHIMDSILQQNKNKVIYVDFWGTWCGPCLAEMFNSKVVEHEMKDKDVVFVYVCLNSEEKQWKDALDKYRLGGQHYFLSDKQSKEIRNLVGISGVPFYLLIDKDGVIKEKGGHLKPLEVKNIINEMLK